MKNLIKFLKDKKITYKENVSFKTLTTYKCGGTAKMVVNPSTIDLLLELIKYLKEASISYKVFGNGSNILASDKTYNGVIIKLDKLNKLEITDDDKVIVGAGYNLAVLANKLSRSGLSGLEFACGIPGTIGGAIYMNAGAYLKDMSSIVKDVTLLDTNSYKIVKLSNSDMKFSYRSSILSKNKHYIVVEVTLKLEKGDKKAILKVVKDRLFRRIESQPLEYPSAGSVFRNPKDNFAGKLIEDCGFKGYSIGGALVSEKHANFIVNYDNAKAEEIKELVDLVHDKVKEKYKVDLHQEQELFNWDE